MRKLLFAVLCMLYVALPARAQNYLYATGSPAFSTQLPIDQGFVNVNNGEIHLEIPLATKQQRGDFSLNERLIYDSRIWKIVQNGSSIAWQPTNVPNSKGGWVFSSGAGAGTITFSTYTGSDPHSPACGTGGSGSSQPYSQYMNWTWTDPNGTAHVFPSASTVQYGAAPPNCTYNATGGNSSSSGYASDGSGYYLALTNYTTATVTDLHGVTYHPTLCVNSCQSQTSVLTDRNGNYWSTDANGNLIDTSGLTPVLVSSSGNNTYYDVLGVNGARERYTVTTQIISYKTAFKETGVTEVSGSFTAITSIGLPDGSSYLFSYDSGTSGNYGELTSMTLPTGGVVTFGYSNYEDSFNNQNRWLTSILKNGGTTTFTPKVVSQCSSSAGCQETVTVLSPAQNDTVYTFSLDKAGLIAGSSWLQGITVYQGTVSSGKALQTTSTSYAYSTYSTTTFENGTNYVTGSYETPTSVTNEVTLPDIGYTAETLTTFSGPTSLPAKVTTWDFASTTGGTPLTQTTYTYGPSYFPTSIVVADGSGNTISSTTYGYDESTPTPTSGVSNHASAPSSSRGNRTSEHDWINTSNSTLTKTMAYYDTGTLLSATPPEGTTTYGYDSTKTFATSVTPPTPSSGISFSWSSTSDASTGLPLTKTDPNGTVTTYSNYDSFGRVQNIGTVGLLNGSTQTVSQQAIHYESSTQVGAYDYQNASTYADTETLLDGYGRTIRTAVANGQGTNPWYQQDTCYDTSGHVSFQSYAYQGTGFAQSQVCSGAGDTYSYDALGRVLSIAHADGTSINYSYTGRATKVVDENGVTRITQVDGLGRLMSVCEVSGASQQGVAPAACGQDIANTKGFLTTYTYSTDTSNDQVTKITQGAQTRTFVTDSLGRSVSTTEPERGNTTYSYAYSTTAGLGLTVTRKRPQANQTSSSVLTTTTTQYDSLGRVVSVTYSDGTPAKSFAYDTNAWVWFNFAPTNLKGRMYLASSQANANTTFSYDAMGRINEMAECTPSGCGNGAYDKHIVYSYDWAGNLTSEWDPAAGNITYGRSPAGELTSVTNNTYTLSGAAGSATLLSNPTNGPNGPISYNFGNGLSQFNSYDTLGRLNGGWVCAGAPSGACSNPNVPQRNGFYVYWSGSRAYASGENYVGQGMTYQYDDFNRLTGMKNSAGTATYTYDYDLYGNRVDQNALQGGGSFHQSYSATTNQLPLPYTYDAAGNMTHDASGGHNFTYDAEGNILQVDAGQSDSWTFVFDALNHRVRAQYSGGSSEGVYDIAGHNTSGWSGPTTPSESHIFADSLQIAFRSGDGKTYFTHKNWMGTDRVTTDLNGNTGATYTSLPFGDGGSENVSESYAGWDFEHFGDMDVDYWDSTYHAQFRNYSELQARWLSPDPYNGSYDASNPQSFNRYSYVGNNPLSFIDPSGLQCTGTSATYDGQSYGGTIACSTGWLNTLFSDIGHLFGFGRPSFKGVVGSPRPPSGKVPCSSVPTAPPGEDYSHNMALQNGMSFDSWLLNELPQGDWDWKDLVDRSWNPSGKSFAAAGNFNYGATCFARGYSLTTCQSGAGVAAYFSAGISFIPNLLHGINPFTMGPGIPFMYGADGNGTPTYGDQTAPTENPTVIAGWNYGASGGCQP